MEELAANLKTDLVLLMHYDGKKYDKNGIFIEPLPMILSGFLDGNNCLQEIPTFGNENLRGGEKESRHLADYW